MYRSLHQAVQNSSIHSVHSLNLSICSIAELLLQMYSVRFTAENETTCGKCQIFSLLFQLDS